MESIFYLYALIIIMIFIMLYLRIQIWEELKQTTYYKPYWMRQNKLNTIDENTPLNNVL